MPAKLVRVVRRVKDRFPKVNPKYAAGGLLAVIMVAQFAYPSDKMLPRTYVGNTAVGMQSVGTIRSDLESRRKLIAIEFNGKVTEFDPAQAGIELKSEETANNLPRLKWSDRIIPLWPFLKMIPKKTVQPVIARDQEKLAAFSATLANNQLKQPVDAFAEIKESRLIITEAKEGEEYSAEAIKQSLTNNDPFYGDRIAMQPVTKPAVIYAKDLQELKKEFDLMVSQTLKISYGNTAKQYDGRTVASWLKVIKDPETSKSSLGINTETFDTVMQDWNREYTVAPGTTQLRTLDNIETSRKNGPAGRTLDTDAIKKQVAEWAKKPVSEPVALAAKTLAPRVVVSRTYSQSSAGLLAKLTYWLETHAGSYQVAIRELGGQGREASHNVAQQTVMASTYKTFLAFVAYKQSESGALDLNAGLVNGKNIEQCIEVMIVKSDNDCPIALGKHIGWAKVDEIIAANGFSNVKLNNYNASGYLNGDKLVNAREQASFLAQLSEGVLINQSNTARLLDYMKRQVYRAGIPAGSKGAVVADKVGFLEGYLHDVGIVYGPKATYALVIMSKGSSWTNISDLALAVYEFMNE